MSDTKEKTLTEDGKLIGQTWAESGAQVNMLLKEEFNQLQLLKEELAAQKTMEKNQISQLWMNQQLMKHQIDSDAFAKVVEVREKMTADVQKVQADEKAHDAKIA